MPLYMDLHAIPTAPGFVFTSTGTIPGSRWRWHDRSMVTEAERPSLFEFVTEAAAAVAARWRASSPGAVAPRTPCVAIQASGHITGA